MKPVMVTTRHVQQHLMHGCLVFRAKAALVGILHIPKKVNLVFICDAKND